jgi:hypothetical protein
MNKSLISALVAATMLSGTAFAQAISSSTYRWTDADGNLIREYTETKQYKSIEDAQLDVKVGAQLPPTVTTTYELPATVKVEPAERDKYRYVIINDRPVIVEKENRKVIHVFTP